MNNRSKLWFMIASVSIFLLTQATPTSAQAGPNGGSNGGSGGPPGHLKIGLTEIQSLAAKLQNLRGQLSSSEASAMNRMLVRAASDPSDDPRAIIVIDGKHSFFDLRGTGVLADENGDRGGSNPGRPPGGNGINTAVASGAVRAQDREPNRPPPPPPPSGINVLKAALGVVVEGGSRANNANLSATVGNDSPPPAPETINALSSKLQTFGGTLSGNEKAVLNWLMDRASRPGSRTSGGAASPTLAEALGIAAFGSRAAGGGSTWLLRFN